MTVLDKFNLKDRCSIVTGGAMGLGKAMAIALAQVGSNIVIADINKERAEQTAAEIATLGVKVLPVRVDVTNPGQIDEMVSKVMDKFGRIDVLFNNAGIAIHGSIIGYKLEDWHKQMEINVTSIFLVSQAVGKVMIEQKRGSIVNTASMSGVVVNNPQPQLPYNTSKGAVIMLTKSLASEWVYHNIRVNAIAPGYMKTDLTKCFFETDDPATKELVQRWMQFTPMGRPGEPDELAGIAVYLASDASSYVTGQVIVIDGGYTMW
jgi:NAD(P)-dependent dehydrogenase (short-subunit alcohol dehydrogenase family)